MNVFLVFIGSGFGGLMRYSLSLIYPYSGSGFPLNTYLANLFSSLLLGCLMYYFTLNNNHQLKLFMAVGFCGGFSTFSTFSKEVFQLLDNTQVLMAFTYALVSLTTGLLMIAIGYYIAKLLFA